MAGSIRLPGRVAEANVTEKCFGGVEIGW